MFLSLLGPLEPKKILKVSNVTNNRITIMTKC